MSSSFYPNQVIAAADGVDSFKAGANYCILLAEMQSGKSDAFMLVGAELVREGLIDQFVVLSGNAETALRDQARNQREFWRKYRKHLKYLSDDDDTANTVHDTWTTKSVVWSSELSKYKSPPGKTLFIWDESHYAQSGPSATCVKGNRPYQFFQNLGLCADGSPNRGGNLIMSVSATPFSELITNETSNQTKSVVYMSPGTNYIGLNEMLANNQLILFDVKSLTEKFRQIALEVKDEGVGIIRATGSNVDALESICRGIGVSVWIHDQSDSRDINDLLESKAHPHTGVIIVKGKVKMGKQIQKHRIRWCMETAANPNTDTFLQGLAGRCMGYPESSGANNNIKIYISRKYYNLRDFEEYIGMINHYKGSSHGLLKVPSRAANVVKVKGQGKEQKFFKTIPVTTEIDLNGWEVDEKDIRRMVYDSLMNEEIVKTDTHLNWVLSECDPDKGKKGESSLSFASFSNYGDDGVDGDNHKTMMDDCIAGKQPLLHPGSSFGVAADGREVRVWTNDWGITALKGLKEEKKKLTVYIQYLSETPHPSASTLATTTGIEVFRNQTETPETPVQGAIALKLGNETAFDVQEMLSAIEYLVKQTVSPQVPDSVETSRTIESNASSENWKGIGVTSEVHRALKCGGEIYKHIKSNYGLKLACTKCLPTKTFPSDLVRLSQIKW